MAYKLLYKPAALKDLKAIFAWSLAKHPDTTERFASELFDRLDLLAVFPYLGEPIGRKPDVRRLLHAPLHVYYRIDDSKQTVEILHFWHASRQPPRAN